MSRERITTDTLREWSDLETICPPCLSGDFPALADWSIATLNALILGREIPDPAVYMEGGNE